MIGLDLSLTGTGIAQTGAFVVETLSPGARTGLERRNWIVDNVLALPGQAFCIEGLSYGSNMSMHAEICGLWYRVHDELLNSENPPRIFVCPPQALKKFIAGKGGAPKEIIIREVHRRWGVMAANNNEADAVGLLMVGLALIDMYPGELTQPQREVVEALRNPKIKPTKRRAG